MSLDIFQVTYSIQPYSLRPIDRSQQHGHDVQLVCDQVLDRRNMLHLQPMERLFLEFGQIFQIKINFCYCRHGLSPLIPIPLPNQLTTYKLFLADSSAFTK